MKIEPDDNGRVASQEHVEWYEKIRPVPVKIGDKLIATSIGNEQTVTDITYQTARGMIIITIDNGQRIGTEALKKLIKDGKIMIKSK